MHFILYSVPGCKDCRYAKLMIEDFECTYEEREVASEERRAQCERAGAASFPLIYHADTFVGGFRGLAEFLERSDISSGSEQ